MSFVVVTGTGTEIGKTVVTAAIAALAADAGLRVAVVKPAQTGLMPDEECDVDVVRRLSGVDDVHEFVRYPDPLAPASAARRAGVAATPLSTLVARTRELADRDLVLVEGAGGLLVRLDDEGHTIADLATALIAPLVVVATAGLGTLNATALTCEAIRARGLTCAGVVVGSWPTDPDLAMRENLRDFESYAAAPLLGVVPEAAGRLTRERFLETARTALGPTVAQLLPRDARVTS